MAGPLGWLIFAMLPPIERVARAPRTPQAYIGEESGGRGRHAGALYGAILLPTALIAFVLAGMLGLAVTVALGAGWWLLTTRTG